jgi:hypothetical protein
MRTPKKIRKTKPKFIQEIVEPENHVPEVEKIEEIEEIEEIVDVNTKKVYVKPGYYARVKV